MKKAFMSITLLVLSAGHEKAHLDKAIAAFIKVGKELGVIK